MAAPVPSSPSRSPSRMPRKWPRKCERYCCIGVTYFPLVFVYSITTWAVWVEASMGLKPTKSRWIGAATSFLGILLYVLLNWSYTTAVFTNPGSTTVTSNGYSSLPTHVPPVATSFTVKSTGELRYCKKCQARKPDRAHHCSTCRRCVLKMDHHCPWLATCVGLHNYKAFMLFLIYTTMFCWVCFGVSGNWVWNEIISDGQYEDTFMPINYAMLAVISGIIGITMTAFTGWHITLASRGQTTIECLEKTRYLSPLRRSMQHQHIVQHQGEGNGVANYRQQLLDIHSNALPGVTRPEEGEVRLDAENSIPDQRPNQSYDALERIRARERYEDYLDEQDSEKLPNAFDLGWKKNLLHLFGEKPLFWPIPVCNTTGDGWSWEPSPKWLLARDKIRGEREAQQIRERAAGWGVEPSYNSSIPPVQAQGAGRHYLSSPAPSTGRRSPSKADRILGRDPSQYADHPVSKAENMPLRNLSPQGVDIDEDDYEISSDEHDSARHLGRVGSGWGVSALAGGASRLLGKGQAPKNSAWSRNTNDDANVDGGVD